MQSQKMIDSLMEMVTSIRCEVEQIERHNIDILTWREKAASWSILECLEHLNLYGDHYLREIEKNIAASRTKNQTDFKSGWLGAYFAKSILPGKKMKKMKTFRDKDPLHSNLNPAVITRFLSQQDRLLQLLLDSRYVSLNKIRIPTSITPVIRLKLGDTFQFYVNHMIRHMSQIRRIEAAAKATLQVQNQQEREVLDARRK